MGSVAVNAGQNRTLTSEMPYPQATELIELAPALLLWPHSQPGSSTPGREMLYFSQEGNVLSLHLEIENNN
jgi:hypothetical protein